jgi:hydroxymethylpyrimidine pyrophosphatase-like HAD family hydrolase
MNFSGEVLAKGAKFFIVVPFAKPYLLSETEPLIKQVCILESPGKCKAVLKRIRHLNHITAVTLFGYEIEVTSNKATKGNALAFIRQQRGIEKERVMVIGDNENDFSMRDEAGYFIAMGNAGKHIKAVADYITAAVDENGVAEAINTLISGMN